MFDSLIFKTIFDNGLPAFLGALAAYLAIREDLARLKERTESHTIEIKRAHERIDDLLRSNKG